MAANRTHIRRDTECGAEYRRCNPSREPRLANRSLTMQANAMALRIEDDALIRRLKGADQSNVLLVESSISGEQSRSQCHLLAGSSCSGANHRSPISRTAYALALAAGVAPLVAAFAPVSHAQRAVGPFAGLAGAWNGSGRIEMQSGTSERIRCRAVYSEADPVTCLCKTCVAPVTATRST